MTQVSVFKSKSKLSQNHLTHFLIQPSVIASDWCVGVINEIAFQNNVLGVNKLLQSNASGKGSHTNIDMGVRNS